jgi:hypothetical protein
MDTDCAEWGVELRSVSPCGPKLKLGQVLARVMLPKSRDHSRGATLHIGAGLVSSPINALEISPCTKMPRLLRRVGRTQRGRRSREGAWLANSNPPPDQLRKPPDRRLF